MKMKLKRFDPWRNHGVDAFSLKTAQLYDFENGHDLMPSSPTILGIGKIRRESMSLNSVGIATAGKHGIAP